MKIIHTSDWHIGKIVNEFSMIEDQKYVLNQLMALIDEQKPQVLIIAGDIYDRSIPPVEGVELLDEVLHQLINEKQVKVLAISGNHDSGGRLGFGSSILKKQGLYMIGDEQKLYEKVILEEDGQIVHFYLVPYKDPAVIRKLIGDKAIRTHQEAMEVVVSQIHEELDEQVTNILIAHGYVTMHKAKETENVEKSYSDAQLETSESERPLAIGGTDLIDGKIFDDFDYVALGHLHGRQYVGREGIRYSGSLLKYSFSEVKQIKGVTMVEVVAPKTIQVESYPLKVRRDFRVIEGKLHEVIEEGRTTVEGKEDYLQVVLTDEGELMNPIEQLRAVYPHVMMITKKTEKVIDESQTAAKSGYKTKSEAVLFEEFYGDLAQGVYTQEKQQVLNEVIHAVLRKEVDE